MPALFLCLFWTLQLHVHAQARAHACITRNWKWNPGPLHWAPSLALFLLFILKQKLTVLLGHLRASGSSWLSHSWCRKDRCGFPHWLLKVFYRKCYFSLLKTKHEKLAWKAKIGAVSSRTQRGTWDCALKFSMPLYTYMSAFLCVHAICFFLKKKIESYWVVYLRGHDKDLRPI